MELNFTLVFCFFSGWAVQSLGGGRDAASEGAGSGQERMAEHTDAGVQQSAQTRWPAHQMLSDQSWETSEWSQLPKQEKLFCWAGHGSHMLTHTHTHTYTHTHIHTEPWSSLQPYRYQVQAEGWTTKRWPSQARGGRGWHITERRNLQDGRRRKQTRGEERGGGKDGRRPKTNRARRYGHRLNYIVCSAILIYFVSLLILASYILQLCYESPATFVCVYIYIVGYYENDLAMRCYMIYCSLSPASFLGPFHLCRVCGNLGMRLGFLWLGCSIMWFAGSHVTSIKGMATYIHTTKPWSVNDSTSRSSLVSQLHPPSSRKELEGVV